MSTISGSGSGDVPFVPVTQRYRLIGTPMEGGMATVQQAQDLLTGQVVAIKRVHRFIKLDRGLMERFRREIRSGDGLNHPYILRSLAVARDKDGEYLVLEWAGRGSLMDRLKADGKFPVAAVLDVARKIGSALQYAHEQGFVHRDVKPHNILLDDQGVPKLADFGLARAAGDLTLTASMGSAGSPLYMSPEQLMMSRQADARSDLYSLGKTLYHLATGQQPVSIKKQLLPRRLRAPLLKAMRDKPEDRYPSVAAFLAELDRPAWRPLTVAAVVLAQVIGLALIGALFVAQVPAWRERFWPSRQQIAAPVDPPPDPATDDTDLREQVAQVTRQVERLQHDVVLLVGLGTGDVSAAAEAQAALRQAREAEASGRLAEARDAYAAAAALLEQAAVDSTERAMRGALEAGRLDAADLAEAGRQLDRVIKVLGTIGLADERLQPLLDRKLWLDAARSIADTGAAPAYEGLRIGEMAGLVPLGQNLITLLWEFWLPASGPRPVADPDRGGFRVDGDHGMVLVLLPGNSVDHGAQATQPGAVHHDAAARVDEGPVRRERVAPFLMSKFELTQAQLARLHGAADAQLAAAAAALPAPVAFTDAAALAERHALCLPGEVEWEYACRSGSGLAWFCSESRLSRYANLADRSARRADIGAPHYETFDDGFAGLAPVGALQPNLFGLHDMHGNLAEWCESTAPSAPEQPVRGGGFGDAAERARCAARDRAAVGVADRVGVRFILRP